MTEKRPIWVKLILCSLPTRAAAMRWVVLSLIGVGGCLVAAPFDIRFLYAGLGFLIAAGLYWSAMHWVDQHDSWVE